MNKIVGASLWSGFAATFADVASSAVVVGQAVVVAA